MRFFRKYPVKLNELLMAPVVFRENTPSLQALAYPSGGGLRDLAELGGFRYGAIRTALSRLRSGGFLETFTDDRGATRYRAGPQSLSVNRAVLGRPSRPDGFLLAIFSFAAKDTRERQHVRDALRYHGFQRLAQNVYINGQIDTAELEREVQQHGLADHLYLFRCTGAGDDPALQRKLTRLFDVKGRARELLRYERELKTFLEERGVKGDALARRVFAAGPVHYRVTFTEEPPLPARFLPADYPLERVTAYFDDFIQAQAATLVAYCLRVNR